MEPSNLATLVEPFVKVRDTNTTDNGFPSRIPVAAITAAGVPTGPSGRGDNAAQATASAVFDLATDFSVDVHSERNVIIVLPFGAGANNATFSMRVIGWRKATSRGKAGKDDTAIWIPVVLVEVACTISSTPIGLAGKDVAATDLFADTITLTGTTSNDDIDVSIISPANDTIGHFVLDLKGFQKVEFTFTTGGSATNCNALVAMY